MEKIREALAKARSDETFRQQHPVADLGTHEEPSPLESNDTAGPADEPVAGREAFGEDEAAGYGAPGPAIGEGEPEVAAPPAQDAIVLPDPDRPAATVRMPTVRAVDAIEVEEEVGEEPDVDVHVDIDAETAPMDEPAPVMVEDVPSEKPAGGRSRRGKLLGIAGMAILFVVLGALALVHVYVMPLQDAWAALLAGDGSFVAAFAPVLETAADWAARFVEVLVGVLGGPEPS